MGTDPETASRSPCSLSPRCERRGAGPPRARLGRRRGVRRAGPSTPAFVGGCGRRRRLGRRARRSSATSLWLQALPGPPPPPQPAARGAQEHRKLRDRRPSERGSYRTQHHNARPPLGGMCLAR
jgi:hypothetical protein